MNILIAAVSILQPKMQEIKYYVDLDGERVGFKARHTNESILRGFYHLHKDLKIDRIIALCSNTSLEKREPMAGNATAAEYYKNVADAIWGGVDFREVNTEILANQERPNGEIMKEVCDLISVGDNVYIDIAGGQRTTTNIIQLLTKILKYKGINNPDSYYSNIQRDVDGKIVDGSIENNRDFTRLADIADGVNEFVTTGKVSQLKSIYSDTGNSDVANLIDAMNDFSDKVRLGDLENIDNVVLSLSESINAVENIPEDDIEYVVLKQMLPVIREKILGDGDSIDYPRIVRWCVDNGLIQQALAVFVEKIPVYMYGSGYFRYKGDENDFSQNGSPILSKDFETNMFFQGIFGVGPQAQALGSDSKQFDYKPLLKMTNAFVTQNRLRTGFWVKSNLEAFKADRGFVSLEKMINGLMNNVSVIRRILGTNDGGIIEDYKKSLTSLIVPSDSSEASDTAKKPDTLQRKIDYALQVESGNAWPSNFDISVDNRQLSEMMLAYIYAKAMRNRISHISSEENLSAGQVSVLERHGYDFGEYNIATLSENITHALSKVVLQ